jgi:hypothetical protein
MYRFVVLLLGLVACDGSEVLVPDMERSEVSVDRTTGIADGIDAVHLTISVRSSGGQPIAGRAVTLTAVADVQVGELRPTDADGQTSTTLRSVVAGPKTLSVTIEGDTPVMLSGPVIEFVPGPPTKLAFLDPPNDGEVGSYLPTIRVAFTDAQDNVVTTETGIVALNLVPNPNNASLTGTTMGPASGGIATFTQVGVLAPGTNLVMEAHASGVVTASSDPFDVGYGPPTSISTLTISPTSALADGVSGLQVVAVLRNAGGLAIPGEPVTLTASGTGNAFYPTATGITDAQGQFVATLTSIVAETKTVTLTSGALTLSTMVTFTPAPCTPRLPGLPSERLMGATGWVNAMIALDVDNDGHRDLAVAQDNTLVILRGIGNGRFHSPVRYAGDDLTLSIASADFDGDGDLDLVTPAYSTGVRLHRNQGAGVFTSTVLATPSRPIALTTGDFDGNGTIDIAARGDHVVWVLAGAGNGMFASPVTYTLDVPPYSVAAASIAVARLNNDGALDLFTADSLGYYTVLLGTGSGTFQPQTSVSSGGTNNSTVGVGDYDGDNKIDIVMELSLLRGNGDGTFASPVNLGDGFRLSHAVLAADLNADGKQDLVMGTTGPGANAAEIRLGNGNATFGTPQLAVLDGVPRAVAVADFNEDGYPDVAAAQYVSNEVPASVSVMLGTMSGKVIAPVHVGDRLGTGRAFFWSLAADFDGNGTLDFVARNDVTENTGIQLSALDGTLTAMPTQTLPAAYEGVAGDFNGDGKLDLLALGSGGVQWARGNGDGTLQTAVASTLPGGWSVAIAAARLDNDATEDVAIANPISNTVTIAFGAGNGTWANAVQYTVGTYPYDLEVVDLDQDGDRDVVVANRNSSSISVLLNQGSGAFAAPVTYAGSGTPYALAVGDLDGDGKLDVVVATGLPRFSFFRGTGTGTFAAEQRIDIGTPLYWIGTRDVDADGTLDVIGTYSGLLVARNFGNATFMPPLVYPTGGGFPAVIADFDRNGTTDFMWPKFSDEPGFTLLYAGGCQ